MSARFKEGRGRAVVWMSSGEQEGRRKRQEREGI
jgi:hypothetical protein